MTIMVYGDVFTPERLAQIIPMAISASEYWMDDWKLQGKLDEDAGKPGTYAGGMTGVCFWVRADDAENTVTSTDLLRALLDLYRNDRSVYVLLREGIPSKEDLDKFWQLCVFDEVLYYV